ncbi:hypothetical protein P171DRAFT_440255 [Karstenula rhodostoma CBS 690.94]|uniref:Uncharacterized protein n=1 Tax=Karstenula rhodostoma CBS 690.94 TaxID=1392251 RepID=A0A9P4PV02_9PLEO|nr:hypothetical protein P171DRAFT_440255 [Karstenula rhodostoma CBS 690.94]
MNPRCQLPHPTHEEQIPDIRQLPLKDRRALNSGPTVKVFDGDAYIMQLPRKLFLAATTNSLLIGDGADIRLPPDTGPEAILTIGCYLLALTTSHKPFKLRCKQDVEADLRILKAARLLHLESYVAHIHSWYWWKLRNRPIDATDVQVVLKVALESDDPFVRLVGDKIAALIRDGTADEIGKLKAYVDGQPYLKSIVAREDRRYNAIMESQAQKAKRIARRDARTARGAQLESVDDEGYVSGSVERKAKGECIESVENAQKSNAKWERKRQEETALSKSLQEKMRLGKKVAVLTRAEARRYERMKGKRCPYKISG